MSDEEDLQEHPEMYGFIDKAKLKNNKPSTITLKLIMERNLKKTQPVRPARELLSDVNEDSATDDETDESTRAKNNRDYTDIAELKASQLLKLTHVHLDREQIGEIDNLAEYLGDVTHLYLQQNLIEKIENLEFLHRLKFICLANNRIKRVENLSMLSNLKFLDLSHNCIADFDVKELPAGLVSLDLRENPCLEDGEKWQLTLLKLNVLLKSLNGESLVRGLSEGMSEMDLGEAGEKQEPGTGGKENDETFETMREKVVERSKLRQKEDIGYLEKISQERKLRLDEARRSITANFKS